MMDIDVSILWPKQQDFPIFRENLKKIRDYFNTVNIYFTDNYAGKQIDDFVREDLKNLNIQCFYAEQPLTAKDDWANVAHNKIYQNTNSKWFMSIHPDIFFKNWHKIFTTLEEQADNYDLIGNPYAGKSISPSFLLIRREVLDKTTKNFSAGDGYDHWGRISEEVQKMGMNIKTLSELGFEILKDYVHVSGVCQDFENGLRPDYIFPDYQKTYTYYYWSCKALTDFDLSWLLTVRQIIQRIKAEYPGFDWEKYYLTEFLK